MSASSLHTSAHTAGYKRSGWGGGGRGEALGGGKFYSLYQVEKSHYLPHLTELAGKQRLHAVIQGLGGLQWCILLRDEAPGAERWEGALG